MVGGQLGLANRARGLVMPISSMTGFARVAGTYGDTHWAWELKSVNGRGFDLRLRAPPGLDGVEAAARECLAKTLARGTVQANLAIERPPRPATIRINEDILSALVKAIETVRAKAGPHVAPATIDGLLAVRGVVEVTESADSDEARLALQAAIIAGFGEATQALVATRQLEGQNIAKIVGHQIAGISELVERAERVVSRQPAALRARLEEHVKALLDNSANLDPDRLHQEAMILAMRADVREELDRLKAHIDHASRLVKEGGAVGRKLDFLAQEFNREANTLCSKSGDKELTEIGLSLKTIIDQLREQVQNIE